MKTFYVTSSNLDSQANLQELIQLFTQWAKDMETKPQEKVCIRHTDTDCIFTDTVETILDDWKSRLAPNSSTSMRIIAFPAQTLTPQQYEKVEKLIQELIANKVEFEITTTPEAILSLSDANCTATEFDIDTYLDYHSTEFYLESTQISKPNITNVKIEENDSFCLKIKKGVVKGLEQFAYKGNTYILEVAREVVEDDEDDVQYVDIESTFYILRFKQ